MQSLSSLDPHSIKPAKPKGFFWLIISAFFITGLYLLFSFFFQIQTIQIDTNLKPEQVSFLQGQNLALLNSQATKNLLLAKYPEFAKITLTKSFPQTLIIKTEKEIEVAQLKNQNIYLSLNKTGKIVQKKEKPIDKKLVTISYYQYLRDFESLPGKKLSSKEILFALQLIQARKQLPYRFTKIKITSLHQIEIPVEKKNLTIIMDEQKPIAKIIYILHNIYTTLQIKGLKPKQINIKFEKPVISL